MPELRYKLPDILQLFRELGDKNKGTEYLEVLLRYLSVSSGSLTEKDLQESVTQILENGGDVMPTIAEKWVEDERVRVVKNSLKEGLPVQTIEKITGLPIDKINRLKDKMAREEEKAARQTH